MKAYEEFSTPLAFPIGGKTYTVPPIGYREGLQLQRILTEGENAISDDLTAESMWRLVMGTAWDDMVKDNVPLEAISRAGIATLADFQWGRDTAEKVWEVGLNPEALAAAMAATRVKGSKPMAEANGTPLQASTNGTKSRKATQPRKKKEQSSPS